MFKSFSNLGAILFFLLTIQVNEVWSQEQTTTVANSTADAVGILLIDVKDFTSEQKLPKKVVKQLQSGMIEWGVRDRLLVFSLVNKRFLDFPIDHSTRYGQNEKLTLPVGDYQITGVGLEMSSGFNVDKILNRGAFFNEQILSFKIEANKTTTLSINPVIKKDRTFAVNFWMPSLMASVSPDSGEVALNDRNEKSIAWPDYQGKLKFAAPQ